MQGVTATMLCVPLYRYVFSTPHWGGQPTLAFSLASKLRSAWGAVLPWSYAFSNTLASAVAIFLGDMTLIVPASLRALANAATRTLGMTMQGKRHCRSGRNVLSRLIQGAAQDAAPAPLARWRGGVSKARGTGPDQTPILVVRDRAGQTADFQLKKLGATHVM